MKKTIVFLILAALLLCACGTAPAPETPAAPSEPSPAPEASAAPASGAAELSALLGELRENVSIATAGSSLRAAAMAARLLDWAEGAELTDEEILAALAPWLGELDDGVPADFLEQLAAVDGAIQSLEEMDEARARGLLTDAGCEDCGYPWSAHARQLAERIMVLAGVRKSPVEN
jgi:hypothetical protein